MSSQYHFEDHSSKRQASQGKVNISKLMQKINEERYVEKKRNLALGVAAVSAVTVFGIILTI